MQRVSLVRSGVLLCLQCCVKRCKHCNIKVNLCSLMSITSNDASGRGSGCFLDGESLDGNFSSG